MEEASLLSAVSEVLSLHYLFSVFGLAGIIAKNEAPEADTVKVDFAVEMGPKDKFRCQYCRGSPRVRMSTTTMMDLPEELLEKIILLLDPVSAIDFSLCDIRLHDLLSNHLTFLSNLDKVEFRWGWDEDKEEEEWRMEDNQELVDKIASFIYTTASPAPLLASLQDTILLQFPAKTGTRLGGGETILMERPFHHHPCGR